MKKRNYPQLIIFHEKHGDGYYLVESREAEEKMFLQVLEERNQYGWYKWMKDYKPCRHTNDPVPTYTKEDIMAMPDSMETEKKRLLAEFSKWEREEKEAQKIRTDWEKIQKTIQEKNGKMANYLLDEFRDGEYDGFEYVSFEHIK